jgi:hypothetical protein
VSIKIRIGKELVLRAFAYSCQGYRSVHRALQEGFWPAFQAYYSLDKREGITSVIRQLQDLTPQALREMPPPSLKVLSRITPNYGLYCALIGRWLNKRRQFWRISVEEVLFLCSTLKRLLDMLELPEAPSFNARLEMQVDLVNCSGLFDYRCYGLPELKRARYIEHFDQTEWVQHWQLWEIMGDPAPITPGARSPVKAAS